MQWPTAWSWLTAKFTTSPTPPPSQGNNKLKRFMNPQCKPPSSHPKNTWVTWWRCVTANVASWRGRRTCRAGALSWSMCCLCRNWRASFTLRWSSLLQGRRSWGCWGGWSLWSLWRVEWWFWGLDVGCLFLWGGWRCEDGSMENVDGERVVWFGSDCTSTTFWGLVPILIQYFDTLPASSCKITHFIPI